LRLVILPVFTRRREAGHAEETAAIADARPACKALPGPSPPKNLIDRLSKKWSVEGAREGAPTTWQSG